MICREVHGIESYSTNICVVCSLNEVSSIARGCYTSCRRMVIGAIGRREATFRSKHDSTLGTKMRTKNKDKRKIYPAGFVCDNILDRSEY